MRVRYSFALPRECLRAMIRPSLQRILDTEMDPPTKKIAKYDPLSQHLRSLNSRSEARMSFADMERLVGTLPASARNHRGWWSNDSKAESGSMASRRVEHVENVQLAEEWVLFKPGHVGGSYRRSLARS